MNADSVLLPFTKKERVKRMRSRPRLKICEVFVIVTQAMGMVGFAIAICVGLFFLGAMIIGMVQNY